MLISSFEQIGQVQPYTILVAVRPTGKVKVHLVGGKDNQDVGIADEIKKIKATDPDVRVLVYHRDLSPAFLMEGPVYGQGWYCVCALDGEEVLVRADEVRRGRPMVVVRGRTYPDGTPVEDAPVTGPVGEDLGAPLIALWLERKGLRSP